MHTLTLETEPLAVDVAFASDSFRVVLDDGRELTVPLAWFPRLVYGWSDKRFKWELIGRGEGLHWQELDEDVAGCGLLAGRMDHSVHPGQGQPDHAARDAPLA